MPVPVGEEGELTLLTISSKEKLALVLTHCAIPARWHPRANPFSPSGCTILAMAEGAQKIGTRRFCPSIVVLVSTSFTLTSIRGRRPMSANAELLRACVWRSVAAEE